jgi:hypothetical protein
MLSTLSLTSAKRHIIILVIVCLAGSLWAAVGGSGCEACEHARNSLGRLNLAFVGVVFYSLTFVLFLLPKLSNCGRIVMLCAGGVHFSLLSILLAQHTFCFPCLLTGLGAIVAAVLFIAGESTLLHRALALVTLGAVGGAVMVIAATRLAFHQREEEAVKAATALLVGRTSPAEGHVDLIVFTRSGCSHCKDFKAGPLPEVQRLVGKMLSVEEREAAANVPTPTTVAVGRRVYVRIGFHSTDELQLMIELASSGRSAEGLPAGIILIR